MKITTVENVAPLRHCMECPNPPDGWLEASETEFKLLLSLHPRWHRTCYANGETYYDDFNGHFGTRINSSCFIKPA